MDSGKQNKTKHIAFLLKTTEKYLSLCWILLFLHVFCCLFLISFRMLQMPTQDKKDEKCGEKNPANMKLFEDNCFVKESIVFCP